MTYNPHSAFPVQRTYVPPAAGQHQHPARAINAPDFRPLQGSPMRGASVQGQINGIAVDAAARQRGGGGVASDFSAIHERHGLTDAAFARARQHGSRFGSPSRGQQAVGGQSAAPSSPFNSHMGAVNRNVQAMSSSRQAVSAMDGAVAAVIKSPTTPLGEVPRLTIPHK